MIRQVNIAEAKAKLSELVDAASRGEDIVLARHGKPLARLTAAHASEPARPSRKFGKYEDPTKPIDWDGWWRDWKAMDREIEEAFERSEIFPPGFAEDAPKSTPPRGGRRRSGK